mgnify:CR=1 FL=1
MNIIICDDRIDDRKNLSDLLSVLVLVTAVNL